MSSESTFTIQRGKQVGRTNFIFLRRYFINVFGEKMSNKSNRKISLPQNGGFIQDLTLRFKLILRLLGDSRVSPLLKLLPIGSLVYLVVPLDVLIGPIDDAAVIWLATYLFVELCPPEVVQEHLDALNATRNVMDSYQETSQSGMHDDVIDGEIVESDMEEK
jgi:uncharacterized membrane protein YkvA (DUF1232 family)